MKQAVMVGGLLSGIVFFAGCGGSSRDLSEAESEPEVITAENMDDYLEALEEEISADEAGRSHWVQH